MPIISYFSSLYYTKFAFCIIVCVKRYPAPISPIFIIIEIFMLSDFNCKILNLEKNKSNYFDPYHSADIEWEKKFIEDVELLGALGFHNLVCQIPYDSDADILYYTNKRIKYIEHQLKSATSRKLSAKFKMVAVPVVYLTDETPILKYLDKLVLRSTNYIFLELPFGHFPDSLAVAINKILYKRNLLPIFANFNLYTSICDNDVIQRVINIKGAGYQFPLRLSVLSDNIHLIKQIIKNGGLVLLGTSCDHNNLNISEISKCLEMLQRRLGYNDYTQMVLRAKLLIK